MLIAGAGGAAHLPGMAAAKTALPVLGVPVESKALKGMDSLLSIVQMPAGVPVGTLAIGRAGAVNAALLAAAILAPVGRGHPGAAGGVPRRADAVRARRARPGRVRTGITQGPAVTLVACIGGGQLGRMLGLAGLPLGLRFRFLDPSPDAPAAEVGELVVGAVRRPDALARLAAGAAVVTYEFENVPVEAAARRRAAAAAARARARAGPAGREGAVPAARHPDRAVRLARGDGAARAREDAAARLRRQGTASRRARRGARRATSWPRRSCPSTASCRSSPCAAATARRASGRWPRTCTATASCAISRAPAAAAPQAEAEELAGRLLEELDYVGVLALELFEVDGRLLANEFAPRVHNTGHWTIDGAATSQFENHLRAILGLPLGAPTRSPRR